MSHLTYSARFGEHMKTLPLFYFMFLLVPITIVSCLPENNGDSRARVRVILELENANEIITAGGDTLGIAILKFVHGESYFLSGSDTLLLKESPEIVIHQNGQNSSKLLVDGIVREGSLQELVFVVEQAPASVQNIDPDFIAGDTLFSLVVEGFYGDSVFSFRSTKRFSSAYELSPPVEADANALYQILLSTDISSWFLNSEGSGLINPTDSAGVANINDNIEGSFRLEAYDEL